MWNLRKDIWYEELWKERLIYVIINEISNIENMQGICFIR